MRKTRYLLIALLALLVSAPSLRIVAHVPSSGERLAQSPIDIRTEDLTFVEDLPRLSSSYGTRISLDVVNTGSPNEFATVRANVPAGGGVLSVGGKMYNLREFHWHSPGEHERDGRKFPMEMHLVHQAADGEQLVVAVWIKFGNEHKELRKIFEHLPAGAGQHLAVRSFNLTTLLPGNLESFRYTGSLTTPPFTEGVRFVVLAETIELSPMQIFAFKNLFPEGNSREVQPLKGRTILTDVELDAN